MVPGRDEGIRAPGSHYFVAMSADACAFEVLLVNGADHMTIR
jgi:hypothetical protein